MTKKAAESVIPRSLSPSCSEDFGRKSCEVARRSTRLRLQPLRKPKTNQKKKKKKKKPNKLDGKMPKKPPTAFFFFLEDFRKPYQEENPEVKSMRQIGKTGGEKWNTMTYERLDRYASEAVGQQFHILLIATHMVFGKSEVYDIATEKREEFHRAMTEYTKKMESGEYDESETDSDFSE